MTFDPKIGSGPSCVVSQRNWFVFPLAAGTKTPAVKDWPTMATNSPDLIAEYRRLRRNLGILCGEKSNLLVLDIDSPEAEAVLRQLEEETGTQYPMTHRVNTSIEERTGFQKYHLYFKWPTNGTPLKNGVRVGGNGPDIRTNRGYVVSAGARNIPGHQYEAVNDFEPTELPPVLLSRLEALQDGQKQRPASDSTSKIKKGSRNDSLTRKAGFLRSQGLSRDALNHALQDINRQQCEEPLPESEVRQIAESVSRYEPHEAKEKSKPTRKLFV